MTTQVRGSGDQHKVQFEEAKSVRAALRQQGYLPIPIEHRGKMPRMKNWQAMVYDPKRPLPMMMGAPGHQTPHLSTGVRCQGICCFDIDIPEPSMAEDVQGMVENVLGPSPAVRLRDGTAKLAIFYRWSDPDTATTRIFRLSHSSKLEIAGAGTRQMVIHGEHADSTDERPIFYRFEEDDLWDIPMADLPPVSLAQAIDIIEQAVHTYPPSEGAEASLKGDAMPPAEAAQGILTAQDFHAATVALAGHMAADGIHPSLIEEYLGWVYDAVPKPKRDKRYYDRREDIARCVRDICAKEARKATGLYRQARMINTKKGLTRARLEKRTPFWEQKQPRGR